MTTGEGGGYGTVALASCGLVLGFGVFLVGTGLVGAATIAIGGAAVALLLAVLVARGRGDVRPDPARGEVRQHDALPSGHGKAARRGAAAGAAAGVVLNGALEVSSAIAQGGLDEEWIDTFLVWDLPSTLVCACVGALGGHVWGRLAERRRRSRA